MPRGRTTRVTRTVWPGLAPPTLNGMLALPLLLLAAKCVTSLVLKWAVVTTSMRAPVETWTQVVVWSAGRALLMEGSQPKILGID